jgi:alkylation response protein AidB-like acyl-CoA dehydrogenase
MGGAALGSVLEQVDEIAPIVREHAAESERLGVLAPAVIGALRDTGLLRMLVPVEFGGAGLSLPESIDVYERIATADASSAWTLVILADGALFARFLAPDACAALLEDPHAQIAGSLNPMTARAERVDGGYRFTGRASYLSGSAHANWIMATAIVTEGGEPVINELGIAIRAGVMPISRADRLDTWHVTGMRATGSTDYEFDGVDIAEGWTFAPFASDQRSVADNFAAIPLWSQLGAGLAACAVGAAQNMIDRFVELAATKVPTGNFVRLADRAPAQIALGEAFGLTQAASAVLHETAEDIWDRGQARARFENDVLARHRLSLVTAVRLAGEAIDRLHDAAGMNAVAVDSVLDRCWRDVHTISQHIILAPARFEIGGRVLMGLDPASPVI